MFGLHSRMVLGLFVLMAPAGAACAVETAPEDALEAIEEDFTSAELASAGCSAAGLKSAKAAWSKAYQLSKPLSITAANDSAKIDAVAAQIANAITSCSAFSKYAYSTSYNSLYTKQIRASGGTLAYAVRVAKQGDECTDPIALADAAIATTASNTAFKSVVRNQPWAAPLRAKLANHLILSDLDGSSTARADSFEIADQFGDLKSVTFRAPRPGVMPVLELKVFKNGTYEETTTNSEGNAVTAKGTWTKAASSQIVLKPASGASSTGTVVRTTSKSGAASFSLKLRSGTELFNYDPDLCSA